MDEEGREEWLRMIHWLGERGSRYGCEESRAGSGEMRGVWKMRRQVVFWAGLMIPRLFCNVRCEVAITA